jgi:hypothetical protein
MCEDVTRSSFNPFVRKDTVPTPLDFSVSWTGGLSLAELKQEAKGVICKHTHNMQGFIVESLKTCCLVKCHQAIQK